MKNNKKVIVKAKCSRFLGQKERDEKEEMWQYEIIYCIQKAEMKVIFLYNP